MTHKVHSLSEILWLRLIKLTMQDKFKIDLAYYYDQMAILDGYSKYEVNN